MGCKWCGGFVKDDIITQALGGYCSKKCKSQAENKGRRSVKTKPRTTTQVIRHEEVTEDVLLAQAKVAEEREKRLQREGEIKAEQDREAAIKAKKERKDYIPDNTDEFKTLFLAAKQRYEEVSNYEKREMHLARMKALSDGFKLNMMSDPNYDRMVQFFVSAIEESQNSLSADKKKTYRMAIIIIVLCCGALALMEMGILPK